MERILGAAMWQSMFPPHCVALRRCKRNETMRMAFGREGGFTRVCQSERYRNGPHVSNEYLHPNQRPNFLRDEVVTRCLSRFCMICMGEASRLRMIIK